MTIAVSEGWVRATIADAIATPQTVPEARSSARLIVPSRSGRSTNSTVSGSQ